MIKITGSYKEISTELPVTTLGTCKYTARIFDVTGEVVHEVKSITGIEFQWITPTVSLVTIVDDAIKRIAEQYPESLGSEPPPTPINW